MRVHIALSDLKPTCKYRYHGQNLHVSSCRIIDINIDIVISCSNRSWWMIEALQKFNLNVLQLRFHFYSPNENLLKLRMNGNIERLKLGRSYYLDFIRVIEIKCTCGARILGYM